MANSKKEEVASVEHDTPPQHYTVFQNSRNWLVPALLIVIILLLIGMIAHGRTDRLSRIDGKGFGGGFSTMRGPERGFMRAGGKVGGSNQAQLRGVVTAVNGSTFTIAGGGATNDVTTNSSTQYQGGSQPKVNDSVLVSGTTNGGTFTATEVVINP
jgi:hypothetical protein